MTEIKRPKAIYKPVADIPDDKVTLVYNVSDGFTWVRDPVNDPEHNNDWRCHKPSAIAAEMAAIEAGFDCEVICISREQEVRTISRIVLPYENELIVSIGISTHTEYVQVYDYSEGSWDLQCPVHESLKPILDRAVKVFVTGLGFESLEHVTDHMMEEGLRELKKDGAFTKETFDLS